jgi:sulfoacetaldehyde dehydrogenase
MSENERVIRAMIEKARVAQREFERWTHEQVDEMVTAAAWAGYKRENMVTKIRSKTKGNLWDLIGVRSVGIVEVNDKTSVTKIAKPKGVVGALIPSTNSEATPIHNIMIALKGANAIILAPHPQGKKTGQEIMCLVHQGMIKLKTPLDLVQCLENPTIEFSLELMRQVDVIVATGGQPMVKAAYSGWKPALEGDSKETSPG